VSAQPPAKKTAGQIEKETLKSEYRMSKDCILSFLLKRWSEAIPSFEILYSLFDILRFAV